MTSIDECEFPDTARRALDHVLAQNEALETAATLMANTIANGDVIQTFGTGHSRSVAQEFSARAGGLVPVGMLSVKDVVMFGHEQPSVILDPTYERISGLAQQIWDLAPIQPGDCFVIISNSGVNAAIIEMAQLAHDGGHPIIAITSRAHTSAIPAQHGAKLIDLATVTLDNTAPAGDATIQLTPDQRVGGISTLAGVFITQLLVEACCRILIDRGVPVPVFRSANLPGSDDHNATITAAYSDRVRLVEP